MEKYDWNDITGRLTRLLRPQTTPVGMKWVRTEEDLRAIPKVRIHDKHLPPCTIVSHAAQFNWTSACRAENVHANYCRGINGMFAPDEKWYSGKMFENVWYDNLDASKAHNRALDLCVLYLSPAQAFLFLAGYQYHEYEKLEFTFVGESTCSDSWVRTFLTGKPAMALPCYADKKFAGVGENDLRVTVTPAGLARAVEGLEGLYKSGLRYPIGSYSLTSDILAGLPEHYLEF